MGRSLSDDPQKLRSELLGVRRRAHAIEKKLIEIERTEEAEDVLTGDELSQVVEWAKGCPTAPLDVELEEPAF